MVSALVVIGVLAAGCEGPEQKPAAEAAKVEPAEAPVKKAEAPAKAEPAKPPAKKAEAPAEKVEAKVIPQDKETVLEAESMALFDAEAKDLAGASGGKAVLLGKGSSIADTVVTLGKGKYEFTVYAHAPDGDHDAFYLTVGDGIRQRLFVSEWKKVVAAKAVTVENATKKACKIELKPAETGMYIDRVVIKPVK
jgi:hypothetical protein